MARAIEEPAWILNMLERLTQAQESARSNPWQVSDAPAHYIEKMLRAIVGIALTIDHLEGRNKVSQDEDREDRLGTVEGLMQTFDAPAQVLAGMVLRELKIEEHDREGH
jgi:transcriptional regulator